MWLPWTTLSRQQQAAFYLAWGGKCLAEGVAVGKLRDVWYRVTYDCSARHSVAALVESWARWGRLRGFVLYWGLP